MTNEVINIRKVKEEDALKWFTLINKVWRDAYSHIFPEEVFIEKENKVKDKVANFTNVMKNDSKNIAYVAEYKGELVGLMCGSITSSSEYFFEYADLIALYIDPKFQGNGIGTSFRKIFENWARENGATKYVICALKDNIKARKVYESWGGKLSEYKQNFVKFDVEYPEVFYLYDLLTNDKIKSERMKELFRYGKCVFTRPNIKYVDEMVEMMNNDKIQSMLFNEKKVFTKEMEIDWINKHQEDKNFSVFDVKTLEYIGNCGFNEIKDNRGEIGLTICEKMQGKHYAKDIIHGLIEYGFNTLGLDEIYSIVFSDNEKSMNCMIQLGFEEYSRDKNILERNGHKVDDVYLKLNRK